MRKWTLVPQGTAKQQHDAHSCGLWTVWNAICYVTFLRAGSSELFVPAQLPQPALLRLVFLLHLEQGIGDRVRQVYEAVVEAEVMRSGPGALREQDAVTAALSRERPVGPALLPAPTPVAGKRGTSTTSQDSSKAPKQPRARAGATGGVRR
jgi:hypothetical protein